VIDAVGNVSSVLLVGGTSELGQAVLTRLTGPRLARVVIAGRPSTELEAAAAHVRACGVTTVEVLSFDAADPARHAAVVEAAFAGGDIDVAIMAVGSVSALDADHPDPRQAALGIDTNLAGPVGIGLAVAARLRGQGHGVMICFAGSIAAGSNPTDVVFAAAQAGFDTFALGVSRWLRGSGARLILVRAGHIPTKLGAPNPRDLPVADPTDVAAAVAAALRSGRRTVVYVPPHARRTRLRLPGTGRFRR